MITIIVASAKSHVLSNLKQNIADTIDVEYELLIFENHNGEKGLCEIYNNGIHKAKYPLLCFMHEDIFFETNGWGKIITDIFDKNKKIGLLGLAGSTYKALTPSSWFPPYQTFSTKTWRVNIKQGFRDKTIPSKHDYYNPFNEKLAKVACLDGVWLCSRKSIIEKHRFDEQLLTGFHGYDTDISINLSRYYDLAVTFDITIQHFSEGNFSNTWLTETCKVHNKWVSNLPIFIGSDILKEELNQKDLQALKQFIKADFTRSQLPFKAVFLFLTKLFLSHKIDLVTCIRSMIIFLKSYKKS